MPNGDLCVQLFAPLKRTSRRKLAKMVKPDPAERQSPRTNEWRPQALDRSICTHRVDPDLSTHQNSERRISMRPNLLRPGQDSNLRKTD
jgi:hypothetical protein